MEHLFILNPLINQTEKEVIIWGTGRAAIVTLFKMFYAQKPVKAFCDTFDSSLGEKICNIPVISFTELKLRKNEFIIIISSMYYEDIYSNLTNLGFADADILIDYDASIYAITGDMDDFKKKFPSKP